MTFEDHDVSRDSDGHMADSLTMTNFAKVERLSKGVAGTGNLLIHGDNLDALTRLNSTYAGRIRSVYLDPPYNNGESYQHYFDSMGHEEWLISVTARLRAIKPLLAENGSVWISIDDSELHYLKVAADEVFGRANFIGTIVWERRTTRENRKVFSRNHEYILSYAKDINAWAAFRNSMPITLDIENRYKNPDNDPRGGWQSVSANVQDGHATPQQFYSIAAPNGRVHEAPKGRCWIYTKPKMLQEMEKGNIWFGKDGNGVPRVKKFLKERVGGVTPETLWKAQDVGTTTDAKKHLIQLFNTKTLFDTPKPEQLIQRILHISSNPGDIVLDAYLGSGTTAAVAHKMGRTYIGLENGGHLETHCVHRLQQVIKGEPGGISSAMGWKGGGGFDFYRLIKNGSTRAKR